MACCLAYAFAVVLSGALAVFAQNAKHERATFFVCANPGSEGRLEKPVEQFQACFMALFSDKVYSKVLDSIAKVDKSLRAPSTSHSCFFGDKF